MRHQRRRNHTHLTASPFVVLADLTIGLTFFFAVLSLLASLANSQGVLAVQRQERQADLRTDVRDAFDSVYPGTILSRQVNGVGDEYVDIRDATGTSIGQIWENGNFQRIMVYPDTYVPGSPDLTENGHRLYEAIAKVIKPRVPSIGYIFVHGIVEPSETGITAEQKKLALELSRKRADAVHRLFVRDGLIAQSASGHVAGQLESKYAISYGTGAELYTRESFAVENWGAMRKAGRVDIVLFYKDELD